MAGAVWQVGERTASDLSQVRPCGMYSEGEWEHQRSWAPPGQAMKGPGGACVQGARGGAKGACSPRDLGRCWLRSSPSRTC